MNPSNEEKKQSQPFLKRLSQLLIFAGVVVSFSGWHWARVRDFVWKGNLDYTPRNTEEIPRPFEQVFENYVEDQWPFVIILGALVVAIGLRIIIGFICKKHPPLSK